MPKKILIVEDNQSFAALLASQLQKAGFEIMVAPDAMIATKQANFWKPDLVILDLMLPACGGISVYQNMKKSVYTLNTPVLVLTGTTDPALRKKLLEMGVQTILQKPYQAEELLRHIHEALHLSPPQTSGG